MVRDLPHSVNAVLSILGDSRGRNLPVEISTPDDKCLKIRNAAVLPLGVPIKIVSEDCLWLGEVIEYQPDGTAVVEVQHSLNNIRELARLADIFTGRLSNPTAAKQPVRSQPEPTLS